MNEVVSAQSHHLIDEETAAKFLGGVSQKHVYNLRRNGGLPFIKVGARIMFRPEALERWARDREQVGTTS